MVTLFPITKPGKIIEFPPIQTLSPIVTGFEDVRYRESIPFPIMRFDASKGWIAV